jgi:hypothetical protein
MRIKIGLFALIFILIVGIVFPAGETTTATSDTTTTIEPGILEDIGKLIGSGLSELDVVASGIELTKGEDENTLTFLEGGSVKIKDALFEDVEKGSSIKLDNTGKITFANLIAREDTSFDFKDKGTYEISKGNRLTYNDGKITVEKEEGKNLFRFKQEVLDESGNNIGKFLDIKMDGDFVNIEKLKESNVLTGNLEFGDNKVLGIGENSLGKITLSKEGRVSEIWGGTDMTMKNVNFKVSGDNLKLYYETDFNPLEHKGENYFAYKKDAVYAGGNGFTTDLGKQNNMFGDMKTTKSIQNIGTKERNLEVVLNGGNLEISRDLTKTDDLAFNIQHEGDFVIKNGDVVIYSEKGYVIENGKRVLSDENSIFLKTDSSKDFSYDLNLNNGEYKLQDDMFTDSKGNVLVNANSPEESFIYNIKNIDKTKATEIKIEAQEQTGARPRDYTYLFDEEKEEGLVKLFDDAAESANQNKYGIKISTEELWTRYMLEGGGEYNEGYPIYDYDHIGSEADVSGSRIGLDYIKSNQRALEQGGFLEKSFLDEFAKENAPLNEYSQEMQTIIFDSTKDSLIAFAGELARRKYVFERDFKEEFGEGEFKRVTEGEKYFWLSYYFNAGEGAGKGELTATKYSTYNSDGDPIVVQGKGRENVYKPWVGEEPGSIKSGIGLGRSARFNALLSESTYKFIKKLGIFNLP